MFYDSKNRNKTANNVIGNVKCQNDITTTRPSYRNGVTSNYSNLSNICKIKQSKTRINNNY